MKKLFFILFVLVACEKDEPTLTYERTCWRCEYNYTGSIPQKVIPYCDKTDLKLPGTGEITEAEIRYYERATSIIGVVSVSCKSYKE